MHFNLFDSQGEGAKKEDHKKTRYSRTSCRTQIFFFPDDANNDILLCLKEQNTVLDVLESQATLIISVRRVWRHIKFCENLYLRPLVLCMALCLNEFWKNFIWKWRDRNKGKFPRDVYWSRLQKYFYLRSGLTQSGWKGWGVRAKSCHTLLGSVKNPPTRKKRVESKLRKKISIELV